MKKIVIALLAVLLVASCIVGIVACDDNKTERENVLDNYIFESNGQVVSEDFVLPGTIGDRTVTWSSDNTAVVAVALSDVDGNWTATITPPEGNTATVTLTVTEGEFTRTFTVQVKPIDVYDIIGGYKFSKERAIVTADFDLDSTATYKGKSASIAWSVDEAYKAYISVDTTGDHGPVCKVNPQAEVTAVQIKATFTYGSETATKTYRMNVYREMKGLELVDYWYNNTGVSVEMSGWVVEVGTAYSSSYNNVTFYMVNDEGTAGYYLYRVQAKDAATGEAIKPGVHVTVTGTTNTNYSGLIETNAGGTVVVDSDKGTKDVRTMIKAIDDEVIGEVPALIYNESRLVSLTNWKVKSVSTKVDTTQLTTQTILTIEKEGVKVAVVVSKYVAGAYADKDNAEYKALCGLASTYKEGDYVSVTGIWSNYNGWQIIPLKSSDVVAAQADKEGTTYAGTSVKSAVSAVAKALSEGGLDKRVTKESKANLPTSVDGVKINYELISSNAITLTKGENAVEAKVVPGNTETGVIQVTYTIGEFSTVEFLHITSLIPTAQTMMSDLEEIMPTSIKAVTDLPTLEGVEIKWEITDAGKVVIDGKEVADEKSIDIVNGQLVPTLSENAVKVKVKASLTYKEEDAYTVFTITVEAGKGAKAIDMATVAENTPYILTIDQGNLSKQLYAQDKLNGYYGATTENFDEASKVYVEFVKDAEDKVTGYKLYFNKDGKYIGLVQSGTYTNYKVELSAADASIFTYDETNKCLKTTVGGKEYYIGTYDTYSTVSASTIDKASSSFPAYLGVETFQQLADNKITVEAGKGAEVTVNPESGKNGTRFTFTVSVDEENYVLDSVQVNGTAVEANGKGVYTGIVNGPTTITVATHSNAKPETFLSQALAAAKALASGSTTSDSYILIGTVKEITDAYSEQWGNVTFTITDGVEDVIIFRYNLDDAKDIKVGDSIAITAPMKNWNGTPEAVATFAKYDVTSIAAASAAGLAGSASEMKVYGYVKSIGTEYSSSFKNISLTITDGTNDLYCFRLAGGSDISVGDYILVTGTPTSYNGSAQMPAKTTYTKSAVVVATVDPGTDTPSGGDTPAESGNTSKLVIADYAKANSWADAKISASAETDYFTATTSCTNPSSYGQNTGKYYVNGENWRIYQNETPSLTITAKTGYTIVSVKVTYTLEKTGIMIQGETQIASDTVVNVNAKSVTFSVGNTGTATNGQIRVTAIEVVYAVAE